MSILCVSTAPNFVSLALIAWNRLHIGSELHIKWPICQTDPCVESDTDRKRFFRFEKKWASILADKPIWPTTSIWRDLWANVTYRPRIRNFGMASCNTTLHCRRMGNYRPFNPTFDRYKFIVLFAAKSSWVWIRDWRVCVNRSSRTIWHRAISVHW